MAQSGRADLKRRDVALTPSSYAAVIGRKQGQWAAVLRERLVIVRVLYLSSAQRLVVLFPNQP